MIVRKYGAKRIRDNPIPNSTLTHVNMDTGVIMNIEAILKYTKTF